MISASLSFESTASAIPFSSPSRGIRRTTLPERSFISARAQSATPSTMSHSLRGVVVTP